MQNKGDLQVAGQTLASLPATTTMTAQDLQRTLGVKLEDLQAQGIIGIQQGGTTRAIKLEDLGGNLQVKTIYFSKLIFFHKTKAISSRKLYCTNYILKNLKGLSSATGVRIQHQGATIMLDAAHLQQLAQAAAAASGQSFERGIPITISTQGATGTVVNAGNVTVNPSQQQGHQTGRNNQQPGSDSQSGDFSNINNLFC